MALTIQEPDKVVNGLLTKAIASLSQLLYQVQREDFQTGTVFDDGGNAEIFVFSLSGATIGDVVYVETSAGLYKGLFTIIDLRVANRI
ncbi:unnamed protein product, partial [marine sediment metagenome]